MVVKVYKRALGLFHCFSSFWVVDFALKFYPKRGLKSETWKG
nr:MAG TPA: hypothetical protein [Caudoviricetes sp.]